MIKLANASTGNTIEERQVRICDMYEKGWEWIIRPPENIANGLAFYAEKLCENNNVLYSQNKRLALNNLLKKNNYNLSSINEKVYCDCSSFVGTCVNGVGVIVAVECFTTSTMRLTLQHKGFQTLKYYREKIQKGDILLREGVHCVIVANVDKMETVGTVYLNDKNSYLNVREKASADSKVVGTLNYGDTIQILGQSGNWYQIKASILEGYCSKNYIKV